jgi:hypothetical protein
MPMGYLIATNCQQLKFCGSLAAHISQEFANMLLLKLRNKFVQFSSSLKLCFPVVIMVSHTASLVTHSSYFGTNLLQLLTLHIFFLSSGK